MYATEYLYQVMADAEQFFRVGFNAVTQRQEYYVMNTTNLRRFIFLVGASSKICATPWHKLPTVDRNFESQSLLFVLHFYNGIKQNFQF